MRIAQIAGLTRIILSYRLKDGKLHTIHIYGNEGATKGAGVFIPKEFSEVKVTSKDTVVATNPTTKEVLMIAHVKIGSNDKTLKKNMKTTRENGTVYIGQIGGKGGTASGGGRGVHSHLVLFPNEASRIAATAYKKEKGDYTSAVGKSLGDFRKLVK